MIHKVEFSQVWRINTYRIVQETIKNTLKHANAKTLTVEAFKEQGKIYLRLTDDGDGFDLTAKQENAGIGIAFLKERASLMSATIEFKSQPGKGTEVTIGFG